MWKTLPFLQKKRLFVENLVDFSLFFVRFWASKKLFHNWKYILSRLKMDDFVKLSTGESFCYKGLRVLSRFLTTFFAFSTAGLSTFSQKSVWTTPIFPHFGWKSGFFALMYIFIILFFRQISPHAFFFRQKLWKTVLFP